MRVKTAVVASSQAAADAGAQMLRSGGSAVDAAVATALASCVADGCNTGLGGYGGHMVIKPANGQVISLDFNAWQPQRLYKETSVMEGALASVIPNVVAGLGLAHETHGRLSWPDVCAPAISLARDGVLCNPTTHAAFAECAGATFIEQCFVFSNEASGATRFIQPDLANTLTMLAERGADWFYRDAPFIDAACASWQTAGRNITPTDWADAVDAVSLSPAVSVKLGGLTAYLPPPGSSGALSALATCAAGQALLARGADLAAPESIVFWAERIAASWSLRKQLLEVDLPTSSKDLRAWIDRVLSSPVARAPTGPGGHTCHLNTADAEGGLVSMTLTHGPQWFGARYALTGHGIIMNAGMPLFGHLSGRRNNGRVYAVTNMSPLLVCGHDGGWLAIGCPGGRRIPANIGLVVARHLLAGMPLQEAISAGRFHAESRRWAALETTRFPVAVSSALAQQFNSVRHEDWRSYYGPLSAIRLDTDGQLTLGLDDRETLAYAATTRDQR